MIVYFADRNMNILGQASTNLPKGIIIKDDTKTEEIETGVSVFGCRFAYSKETRKRVEQWAEAGNYILRSNDDENEFYTIINVEIDTENQDVYIYAEDAGMDLLNEVLKSSGDGVARSLKEYIENAAYDSGFEIGINESDDTVKTYYALDEQTASERILYVAGKFGYEISYSFAIECLEVTHKYINIYKKRGKDTGVQLRLNREIEKITIKKSVENLATALLCTGSADASGVNISLEGYHYDDGDFYTSGHYLYSRDALGKWSRYLWHKEPKQINNVGHIVRTFTYDTVSQEELCKKAVEELKKICDIERNYEVQITHLPDNVKIGDVLNVVDDAGELYLQSRLLKLETSVVAKTRTATLGDYLIRDDGISEKVEQLATQFKNLSETRTLYTWIVYADDSFGSGISLDPDGKAWIGIIGNQVLKDADLEHPDIYRWSKIQGDPGEPGEKGNDGASVISIEDQYYLSTSSTETSNGNWQDEIPDWEKGKYIWRRYKVTWSDGDITYTNAELDRALNHANEAADLAGQKAEEAANAANTAKDAAQNAANDANMASEASQNAQYSASEASKTATEAKEVANAAQKAADDANADVATINREISTIKEDAASMSEELNGRITSVTETMEASYAKKTDVSESEASLRAEWTKSAAEIQSTMENDYAKKTQLTEVQANLQTQVTQNATDIVSTATAVETVKIDASNAQKKAEEASAAAATAQTVADSAVEKAATAKSAADMATQAAEVAKNEAERAQDAADTAAQAASDADAVAKAAQKDLDTAKEHLADVTNRVGATEEDIEAAQIAVSNAQKKAEEASASAVNAKTAADEAQATADIAKANASTAQSVADEAQENAQNAKIAADNAQKTADEAKDAIGNLANTVTQMDTKIAQNAEQITLAATKKEVEDKLSGYSTTSEMNAAINISAIGIKQEVTATYATKTDLESNVNALNASIELKIDEDNLVSALNASADIIHLSGNRFIVESNNFNLTADGALTATGATISGNINATSGIFNNVTVATGTIGGFTIDSTSLRGGVTSSNTGGTIALVGNATGADTAIAVGANSNSRNFVVKADGSVTGNNFNVKGVFTTTNSFTLRDGNTYEESTILSAASLRHKGYILSGSSGLVYTSSELTISSGNLKISTGENNMITFGCYQPIGSTGGIATGILIKNSTNSSYTNISKDSIYMSGSVYANSFVSKNATTNYIGFGNYNGSWNNYYYSAGYHAFYVNSGDGMLWINGNGLSMSGQYGLYSQDMGNYVARYYVTSGTKCTAIGNNSYATRIYGSSVWANKAISTSDERLKTDFKSLDEMTIVFMELEPISFRWKQSYEDGDSLIHFGLKAGQVKAAFVKYGYNTDDYSVIGNFGGYMGICYDDLFMLTMCATQKTRKELMYQAGKIDLHETIIQDLQNQVYQLKKQLKELKQAVG